MQIQCSKIGAHENAPSECGPVRTLKAKSYTLRYYDILSWDTSKQNSEDEECREVRSWQATETNFLGPEEVRGVGKQANQTGKADSTKDSFSQYRYISQNQENQRKSMTNSENL